MSGNGRRVSVYVNESALKAWLETGKPANTPTPETTSPTSSPAAPPTDEPKEKLG